MKRKSGKRSWKTLYFEFAFLGLKVIVSVKRDFSKSVPLSLKLRGLLCKAGLSLTFGALVILL
ncbi:hypothetical protein HpCK26_14750 [Helicobacter pylori]